MDIRKFKIDKNTIAHFVKEYASKKPFCMVGKSCDAYSFLVLSVILLVAIKSIINSFFQEENYYSLQNCTDRICLYAKYDITVYKNKVKISLDSFVEDADYDFYTATYMNPPRRQGKPQISADNTRKSSLPTYETIFSCSGVLVGKTEGKDFIKYIEFNGFNPEIISVYNLKKAKLRYFDCRYDKYGYSREYL